MLHVTVLLVAAMLATPPTITQSPEPTITRLSPTRVRIGKIEVDTAARELRVSGRINQVTALEFVGNTPGGIKEYESAITVDSDAKSFNAALLLLGLDPNRARVPAYHLDPEPPAGDPVSVEVEFRVQGIAKRIRAEELLWNEVTRQTYPTGPWVYTGSRFVDGQFLSEADGVLIGFVHSPASLIDNPRKVAASAYGEIVLNPNIGLRPNMPVTLIVRALDRTQNERR